MINTAFQSETSGAVGLQSRSHPVIDLILTRFREKSTPKHRHDDAMLALAFEGGAMRGITSAGMGLALVELGLTDVFDVVYGSSAGAFNGAYFVSRQGALGFSIYYEDVNNRRFIDRRRVFGPKPIVSLDYMFDVAMSTSKPLDFDAIANSQIPLRIVASNLTERRSTVFDHFTSRQDLLQKLRASAAMPYLAGPPITIDGLVYSDASLYESIPFRSAIDKDLPRPCTHVLVLRSRPEGMAPTAPSLVEKFFLGRTLARHNKGLYDDFVHRFQTYAADVEFLRQHTNDRQGPPYLYQVTVPSGAKPLSQLEDSRDKLVAAAALGMKAMVETLTGCAPMIKEVNGIITPVGPDGRMLTL